MSAISLKSITGITSITTPAGVDNVFTVHTNDTTERFRVDSTGSLNIAGISTFNDTVKVGTGVTALTNGNVSIGGTLELFNTTGDALNNPSEIKLSSLTISQHQNTGTYKVQNSNATGTILLSAGGSGYGGLDFWNGNFSRQYLTARDQGSVKLFHNNTPRFETSGVGATVYGNLNVTADLDVDGHTNLDNISIAGVTTASQGLNINVSPAITIRDGTTEKGYIGFNANDPFIGRKNGVGLAFQNNKVRPVDGDDGSPSNNTVDLGEPTYRFKDGYFAGNLVMASGHGIDFSATGDSSGSMTSELLDDYEEGSWTPQYQNGSGSITVNGSYSIQFGRYIKIGKMVYVEGALRANVSNNSNGTYDIGGLPFTVSNDTDSGGVLQCKEQNSWTVAPDHFSPMKNTTAARARVGLYNGAASYTNGNTSHFNSGSTNNNRIYFSGSYIAA